MGEPLVHERRQGQMTTLSFRSILGRVGSCRTLTRRLAPVRAGGPARSTASPATESRVPSPMGAPCSPVLPALTRAQGWVT